jgi:methionyl-tRNA synthetase
LLNEAIKFLENSEGHDAHLKCIKEELLGLLQTTNGQLNDQQISEVMNLLASEMTNDNKFYQKNEPWKSDKGSSKRKRLKPG